MDEMLNGSYNFIAKKTNINTKNLVPFINELSLELEKEHTRLGLFCDTTSNIQYNPINFFQHYNIFLYQNEELYDLLQVIKDMTIEMCNRLNIDYNKQKYHVHGWINRYHGELNNSKKENYPWHTHGDEEDHFHGILGVDSEPSVTHYRIDGQEMDLQQINGRVVLLTNYEHSHGLWNEDRPRITIAFNVKPIKELPDIKLGKISYIPL